MQAKDKDKLLKTLALLSSDVDGEVLGAARAAVRIMNKSGVTIKDIILVKETDNAAQQRRTDWSRTQTKRSTFYSRDKWRSLAGEINVFYWGQLNLWEQEFVENMDNRISDEISNNQWRVIVRLAEKFEI